LYSSSGAMPNLRLASWTWVGLSGDQPSLALPKAEAEAILATTSVGRIKEDEDRLGTTRTDRTGYRIRKAVVVVVLVVDKLQKMPSQEDRKRRMGPFADRAIESYLGTTTRAKGFGFY